MPFLLLISLLWLTLPLGSAVAAPSDTMSDGAATVRAASRAVLENRFPAEAYRLDIRVLRTGGSLDSLGTLRLVFPASNTLPRAHTQVDVLAEDPDGIWTKVGWALLYIAHFDSVAVARTGVRKDDPVRVDDLEFAWMETTRFQGDPLRPSDLRALLATGEPYAATPLHAGRALRTTALRTAYAVDTGAAVEMTYERHGLTLRLACKAREPGFNGDVIRLYAPDTQLTYRARLTGLGTALWIETL